MRFFYWLRRCLQDEMLCKEKGSAKLHIQLILDGILKDWLEHVLVAVVKIAGCDGLKEWGEPPKRVQDPFGLRYGPFTITIRVADEIMETIPHPTDRFRLLHEMDLVKRVVVNLSIS